MLGCLVKCRIHATFTFGPSFSLSLSLQMAEAALPAHQSQRPFRAVRQTTASIILSNDYSHLRHFLLVRDTPQFQLQLGNDTAMCLRLVDDAFCSGRYRSDRFTAASLEDESDDPLATTLRAPRSGYVPSPLFYQEWFESTYTGDGFCPTVQNFLSQMNFWKLLMEENGMELEDAYIINTILRNLPDEFTEFRSYLEPLLENAINCGEVFFDELDEHLRSSEPHLQIEEAKTEIVRKAPAIPKALPSSRAFDVEHINYRLRTICLEYCVCVKDYLGREYFWRRLLKEHGKTISESNFLGIMIGGLSAEYRQIGAHYNMLRSTPAFEEEMLDEFASDLRVLERDITRRLRVLEQNIAMFEVDPSLNSLRFFLEELCHRRDPANVIQLDWKVRAYFGLIWCLSLSATDIELPTLPEKPMTETLKRPGFCHASTERLPSADICTFTFASTTSTSIWRGGLSWFSAPQASSSSIRPSHSAGYR